MKYQLRTLALIAGLIVTLSVGALAAGQKANPKGKRQTAYGTINSINNTQLVLTEKVKGKDTQMTFAIDPSTQKTGNLAVGSNVTVQYHPENNQNMATAVRERSATTAKASKTDKPAKKS